MTLFYQNIGKEPARNLTYYQEARLASVMKENDIVTGFQLPTDDICEKAYNIGIGSAVFPSTSPQYSLGLPPQKGHPLDPTIEKQENVLIWRGCLKYDTFQSQHYTKFCYWLRSEEGAPLAAWQWNFCLTDNDFD